jgi:hypothetical protein
VNSVSVPFFNNMSFHGVCVCVCVFCSLLHYGLCGECLLLRFSQMYV